MPGSRQVGSRKGKRKLEPSSDEADERRLSDAVEQGVVLLRHEGGVFSSGHNLKDMFMDSQHTTQQERSRYQREVFRTSGDLLTEMRDFPFIVIAVVDGHAAAAGCQVVVSADLAICTSRSEFSVPGINSGLFCSTPAVALSGTLSSPKLAMEMLCTGDSIDAERALQFGLVNRVVDDPEALDEETLKLARRIARQSGDVLAMGKRGFYKQASTDLVSAYALATNVMIENAEHGDCVRGIDSFFKKKHATWES
eukprot:TRINITY_DN1642_c0_g1_i8.p1 TRINITY_DN1642_c0_g1~~TRINITY_DN1642_c0_g1_i8.p1  ORF type:complete len:253 (-),score=40.54 TRINITY_DN1642_c0_g1_i8:105-863(-)